jgi:hypothetical protein
MNPKPLSTRNVRIFPVIVTSARADMVASLYSIVFQDCSVEQELSQPERL